VSNRRGKTSHSWKFRRKKFQKLTLPQLEAYNFQTICPTESWVDFPHTIPPASGRLNPTVSPCTAAAVPRRGFYLGSGLIDVMASYKANAQH